MWSRIPAVYVSILVLAGSALGGTQNMAHAAALTAEQIVAKNTAARGGLRAWRAVQSMTLSGQLQAGGRQNLDLPFSLEMKRPHKLRLELKFAGQTAVQVYDGVHGWKLRPYLGRNEAQEYTADELKQAASQSEFDGPLIDSAAKGNKVVLEGMEKVEGRDVYRLKVRMPDGEARHVWVDAQTFLDVKIEGVPRILDGKPHAVEVAFRDYRSVHGLMVPYLLETTVRKAAKIPGKGLTLQDVTSKIVIENVVWNPQLADARFTKPQAGAAPQGPEARQVARALP